MRVLHVGCGEDPIHKIFCDWDEVRLDIDPKVNPDIVADLQDMGEIGEFMAVYGCHVLEHLAPHEVKKVIQECFRVLRVGGFVMIVVPDLEGVKPTREVMYQSPAGPITGLDMYYGKESLIEHNLYMRHKTGFVKETLEQALAPFNLVRVSRLSGYNLLGVGAKTERTPNAAHGA